MTQSLVERVSDQTFTEATVRRMYQLVERAKTDPTFQKLIYGVVNRAMQGKWKDYRRELSTILSWARKAADYRRDPYGVELLQDVWATLDRRRGDCDDFVVLICSAAEVLGCPCRIVTVSTRKDKEPNHVYAEALVGGKWLGMDCTMPGTPLGWKPPYVTDKKIWTRRELGLGGSDEEPGVEGLGMLKNNGYGSDGFKSNVRPVDQILAPGVPDDISKTWGAPIPGTGFPSRRRIYHAPIANVSDRTSQPRPGGGVYNPALPIKSMPTPEELWFTVKRSYVPKVLDPRKAWWGEIPTAKEDFNRMYPGAEEPMSRYLKEIASVPESAIAELTKDVGRQLQLGEIDGSEIGYAAEEALEDYALGRMPRMMRPANQRGPRKWRSKFPGKFPGKGSKRPGYSIPKPPVDRRFLFQAPQTMMKIRGMSGLGDIISDVAKSVSANVNAGLVPNTPTSINDAIDQALKAVTGQTATAPKPVASATVTAAKVGIPIGMIAAVIGAAWLISKRGRFQNNPSRRYRSRGRRGGGINLPLLVAGGAAAWYFFLRPGASALPASTPLKATISPVKQPSTTDKVIGAAAAILPSAIKTITSLFDSSPAQPVPGIVTESSLYQGGTSPSQQDNSWASSLVTSV